MPGLAPGTAILTHSPLSAALERGGVTHGVGCGELRATLRGVNDAIELATAPRAGSSLEIGDAIEDAAVRGGAALLCPERPILLPGIHPTVRLTYLSSPIDAGPGRDPVDALFLILAPTAELYESVAADLLERLGDVAFLELLAGRTPAARLLFALGNPEPYTADRG